MLALAALHVHTAWQLYPNGTDELTSLVRELVTHQYRSIMKPIWIESCEEEKKAVAPVARACVQQGACCVELGAGGML